MLDILFYWRDYKKNWVDDCNNEYPYYWHTNAKKMLELHAGDKLWLVTCGKNVGSEVVQAGFPDCEAKRQVSAHRWQRVRIEFEYESRNFREHGHSPEGCDMLVCWRHNWPECPDSVEVLELKEVIKKLAKSVL